MHVDNMAVTRKTAGPNCSGQCTVWIKDQNGAVVANATVYVTATGPVGGSYNGVTGSDGSVFFETGKTRSCEGEWCFEVTNVTHASCTYDAAANVVTQSCESGHVYSNDGRVAMQHKAVGEGLFYLASSNPNPFSSTTSMGFNLPKAGYTRLEVFDAAGRLIDVLIDKGMSAGFHRVAWDASGNPAGVYFYRLMSGSKEAKARVILIH
jgi:hypothetical protein